MAGEIKWEDRKRILGLPITFTKYYMDDERLYVQKGLLNTEINELLLYRILDVKSSRSLWQKIFGVGTVTIYSADQSNRTLKLESIKDPTNVHRFISDTVEFERKEHGIAGREMYGTAVLDTDPSDGVNGIGMPPPPPEAAGDPPDFGNYR